MTITVVRRVSGQPLRGRHVMQAVCDGFSMSVIDVLVPENAVRRMHVVVADRLRALGHDVALVGAGAQDAGWLALDRLLRFERKALRIRINGLLDLVPGAQLSPARKDVALRLDLAGGDAAVASPVLKPVFSGFSSPAGAALLLLRGQLPDVDIVLDGQHSVAHGKPMVDSRLSLLRGMDDVLAGMVTLMVAAAHRYPDGGAPARRAAAGALERPTGGQLTGAWLLSMVPRQIKGTIQRLVCRVHRWDVSYRFHKGARVVDTGLLAGEPWIALPDDGRRFYADPFPFEWEGRHFIFVEDCPYDSDKAVISVAEVFANGTATVPRCVLDEPHHLSYPQVFAHDGEIWMLPEGGSGGNLILYRAESFPGRWVRHAVLIPDRELFDATLLEHEGRLWLFATERYGYGSASDTLVVFHAPDLQGPWVPHPANPVTVDRTSARPGGHFVRVGDRIVLPLQDGTNGYGGALGLADLVELNETTVRLTTPVPILSPEKSTYPKVHTLTATGQLEALDCIVPVRRGKGRRAR